MKVLILITALIYGFVGTESVEAQSATLPTSNQQIAAAVSAAPEPMQEDATVLGYIRPAKLPPSAKVQMNWSAWPMTQQMTGSMWPVTIMILNRL